MNQPAQQQDTPGTQGEMTPTPDCGEKTYRGMDKLKGKTAVITGGDSGIGRAVAIAFAREGADVVISYLNEDDDAKETARWVEEAGRRAVLVPGDLDTAEQCRRVIDTAVREFGKVDILVNNAAYQIAGGNLRRGVGVHLQSEHQRHVLPGQGGPSAHGAGVLDYRQLVGELGHAQSHTGPLRGHEVRNCQLLRQPGAAAG